MDKNIILEFNRESRSVYQTPSDKDVTFTPQLNRKSQQLASTMSRYSTNLDYCLSKKQRQKQILDDFYQR